MEEEIDNPNLDKIYAEAGQWIRMVNTIGWTMASIFVPISFGSIVLAVQYPYARWVFCFGSIFLFAFWIIVSFIYRRTSRSARDVLMTIERQWSEDESISLYIRQKHVGSWIAGVAVLQLVSFSLLIFLWILIYLIDPIPKK